MPLHKSTDWEDLKLSYVFISCVDMQALYLSGMFWEGTTSSRPGNRDMDVRADTLITLVTSYFLHFPPLFHNGFAGLSGLG